MGLLRARAAATRWLSPSLRRVALISTLVALVALVVLAGACRGKSEIVVHPGGSATAPTAAVATGTPGATETATPFATGQPSQVVTNVKDLVAKFGYPPGTNFAQMRIPAIGVDARVGARTVGRDAIMPAPGGPADVVWYDMALWSGLGGSPGGGQNAVFSGHVDYADPVPYANVSYRGQGVFSQLRLLSQGDIIEIDYRGQTLRYRVASRQQLTAGGQTDWSTIWSSNTAVDSITLYTCGGAFNFQTREYEDRIVVRATRI